MRDRLWLLGAVITLLAGSSAGIVLVVHLPSSYPPSTKNLLSQLGIQPSFGLEIVPHQFLLKNGSSANLGLVLTPLNGFMGNVTLSASVDPMQAFAPIVSFNSSIVNLNSSLAGSPSYGMVVSTTNRTESGLYNITVTASSGILSQSASATAGVTSVMVTPSSADLLYRAHFTSVAYVGNSTVLESTFEDLGYTSIGITNLKVSLDFGLYEHNDTKDGCVSFNSGPCISHPFVTIQSFEQSTFALTIQIPNGTTVGSHLVTATVSWALGPSNFWPSSELYLVTHGYLVVYSRPVNPSPNSPTNIQNGFLRLLAPILGGSATIAVLTVGLVVWNAKRSEKRNQAMLQYVASAKQSLTQKTCSNCGAPAGFRDKFCGNCGHIIS